MLEFFSKCPTIFCFTLGQFQNLGELIDVVELIPIQCLRPLPDREDVSVKLTKIVKVIPNQCRLRVPIQQAVPIDDTPDIHHCPVPLQYQLGQGSSFGSPH